MAKDKQLEHLKNRMHILTIDKKKKKWLKWAKKQGLKHVIIFK